MNESVSRYLYPKWKQDPGILLVNIDEELKGEIQIAIDFTADFGEGISLVDSADGRIAITDSGRWATIDAMTPQLSFAPVQYDKYRRPGRLFPCWDNPRMLANIQLNLILPETYTAFSNSHLESAEPHGIPYIDSFLHNHTSVKFLALREKSVDSIGFVALPSFEAFEVRSPDDGHIHHELVVSGGLQGSNNMGNYKQILALLAQLTKALEKVFEIKLPLDHLTSVVINGYRDESQHFPGLTIYDSTLFSLFDGARDHVPWLLAYEVCHQVFGNNLYLADRNDLWLQEGLATFCSLQLVDQVEPNNTVRSSLWPVSPRKLLWTVQRPLNSSGHIGYDASNNWKAMYLIRWLEMGHPNFWERIRDLSRNL